MENFNLNNINMKKFLFLSMACLFAAVSCQKDLSEDWRSKPLEEDETFFVNIAVNGTEVTRAYDPEKDPEFDNGSTGEYEDVKSADENAVKTIYFIFYDENGDRVATTQVRKDNAVVGTPENNPSHNAYYSGVVQIDIKHGSLPPASVMAFINPITSTNFDINPSFATLDDLGKTTRERLIDDGGYFAMSKSSYYRNFGTPENPDYRRVITTPLTMEQLAKTREKAEEFLQNDENRVDIYVERYAAKVKFAMENPTETIKLIDGPNVAAQDKVILTFVPEYWAVNAYEPVTYVTKSFYTQDFQSILDYEALNVALGGSEETKSQMPWHWNSPELHRCYWAQSPAYYASRYPRTADDIKDEGAENFALGYYSYNDLVKEAQGKIKDKARKLEDTKDKDHPIYVRENTIAGQAVRNAYESPDDSPKAALPSVILVGHYTVTAGTATEPETLDEDEFFYITGNATNGYSFFRNEEMLKYFVGTTVQFAKNSDGTDLIFTYTVVDNAQRGYQNDGDKIAEKYFTIEHPKPAAREGLVIDSRFVTIQLNEDVVPNIEAQADLYAYIDGKWIPVCSDNLDAINKQMFYTAGTAQGFQGGKVYYTIPIKHLGFYRKGNPNYRQGEEVVNLSPNSKNFNWNEVRTGDFGLVRNHSYSIIVDKIEGLGNGIPDPNDPIVPPTDPEEYFIGARLIVLNWALVPEQHESL